MFHTLHEMGDLKKGNILTYVSKQNTYKIQKGYIVDMFVKNIHKPLTSKFIKLRSLNEDVYWEIQCLKYLYISNKKPNSRRSNFRIFIDKYRKK